MKLKYLFVLLSNLFIGFIFAQPYEHKPDMERLNALYNEHLQESAEIFTGKIYTEQTYLKRGTPFLISDSLTQGWLVYNGHFYPQISLQWDGFQNFVMVKALNGLNKLILINDKIDSFYLGGHLIKNIQPDKNRNLMSGGLYDFVRNGKTKLIVKRMKTHLEEIEDLRVYYRFFESSRFYIFKEGLYYKVTNKKDVLKLFGNKYKSSIKREVRKHDLSWRKDFEQCLLITVDYYDQINDIK